MMAPIAAHARLLCLLLLVSAGCTYWTLFADLTLEAPHPRSCANITALPPPVPAPAFLGVGVFATRRRYQTALERLKACVAARHQQLRKGAGPVCDLAVASSNWRIFVREDARAAANLVARRFSHFLDCGAAGALLDLLVDAGGDLGGAAAAADALVAAGGPRAALGDGPERVRATEAPRRPASVV